VPTKVERFEVEEASRAATPKSARRMRGGEEVSRMLAAARASAKSDCGKESSLSLGEDAADL
jgi:hypothetical protein